MAQGSVFDVSNPATGEVIASVSDGAAPEAIQAVDAAAEALDAWAATSPRERAEILRRSYELMIRGMDELAPLIVAENGKSDADARAEVTYAAEFFRWFAEEAVRSQGHYADAPTGGAKMLVGRVPVGVAALVTPWNFPAAMATRKIAPALAAGCTVVVKPAEETPLTALAVGRLLIEAGVPDGVVNILPTTKAAEVVTTWLEDPRVRKLSFTGSTKVGRILLAQAAERVLNTSLELGGNAPFIVTADADIEAAVRGAMTAKFRNAGQACTAANRFYVHADVHDEFANRLAAEVERLVVGPGSDPATQVGPLITEVARNKVAGLVDAAVADGARVAVQADAPGGGSYYPPTVLTGVPMDASILAEETFGPVAPIVSWTDEAKMLAAANNTEYGLAAYVYAGDQQTAMRLADKIETGMVGINRGMISDPAAPFGGVKQSGIGREGGTEGMGEYQEIRYFSVDSSDGGA